MITLHGRTVVPGYAEGEALVSPEPISGWGGIDPAAGRIIEPRHALHGVVFTGKVLVFPSAKGSSGWSGFFQSTRLLGTAPVAMVITRISTKSALGAVVTRVPALTDLDQDPCAVIRTGDWVRVDATTVSSRSNPPCRPGGTLCPLGRLRRPGGHPRTPWPGPGGPEPPVRSSLAGGGRS